MTTILPSSAYRAYAKTGDGDIFERWQAGKQTTLTAVESWGEDRCFAADTISDKVFARMWGKSYKKGCTVARSELRYVRVLHYTLEGKIKLGELVCNKAIANDLVEIFHELFKEKYPIESILLVDDYDADDELSMAANNTSCFNFRVVAGTKRLSSHSQGRAIDINTLYNPYVKRLSDGTTNVKPAAGRTYANRNKNFSYKINHNDLCYKLFIKHGFKWGGDWRSVKDYQHFEKNK